MATKDRLLELFEEYKNEEERFQSGVKCASTRARNALNEIAKLSKIRRQEILEEKEKMGKIK